MVKINLNELRQCKILIYCNDYTSHDYIVYSDCDYKCGFIEDIYTRDGEIIFSVYGAEGNAGKLKHIEIKVHMNDIDSYDSSFTETYNRLPRHEEHIEYECINIKASDSFSDDESYHKSEREYRLYKNLDFKSLMRILYDLMDPVDVIDSFETAMIYDPYFLSKFIIPKDYIYGMYY